MRIDSAVEPVVREAFAACVAQDPGRFNQCAADIAGRGEDFAREAVTLAVAVTSMALPMLHTQEHPDAEKLKAFAHDFVEAQAWSGITEDNAVTFLHAIVVGERLSPDVLPPPDVAQISLILGAWLLFAFSPQNVPWTDFLDDILDDLESQPTEP